MVPAVSCATKKLKNAKSGDGGSDGSDGGGCSGGGHDEMKLKVKVLHEEMLSRLEESGNTYYRQYSNDNEDEDYSEEKYISKIARLG